MEDTDERKLKEPPLPICDTIGYLGNLRLLVSLVIKKPGFDLFRESH